MLDTHARKYVQPSLNKLANFFIKHQISAITITIISLVISILSIFSLILGHPIISIIFLWLSGVFDALDGTVARTTKTSSELGAFLDITFDRILELGIIIALVIIQPNLGVMLVILTSAIVMSLTIFLTVSSFEKNTGKKSFYYQAGLAERSEGFIFLTLMIVWTSMRNVIGYVFAATVFITALQRFYEGIMILKAKEGDE